MSKLLGASFLFVLPARGLRVARVASRPRLAAPLPQAATAAGVRLLVAAILALQLIQDPRIPRSEPLIRRTPITCSTRVESIYGSDPAHLLGVGRQRFREIHRGICHGEFERRFTGTNFYEVVIDHDPSQTFIFQPKSSTTSYTAFTDLPYREHLIEFVKRTETSQGSATFLGFDVGGVPLPAPTRPTRKIEIIGDSISTGTGAEPGVDQVNCNTSGGSPAQRAKSRAAGPVAWAAPAWAAPAWVAPASAVQVPVQLSAYSVS